MIGKTCLKHVIHRRFVPIMTVVSRPTFSPYAGFKQLGN